MWLISVLAFSCHPWEWARGCKNFCIPLWINVCIPEWGSCIYFSEVFVEAEKYLFSPQGTEDVVPHSVMLITQGTEWVKSKQHWIHYRRNKHIKSYFICIVLRCLAELLFSLCTQKRNHCTKNDVAERMTQLVKTRILFIVTYSCWHKWHHATNFRQNPEKL